LIARIIYAVLAWWGFLNVAEKDRIESDIKKAKRHGYLPSDFEKVHTLVESMESKPASHCSLPLMCCNERSYWSRLPLAYTLYAWVTWSSSTSISHYLTAHCEHFQMTSTGVLVLF